MTSLQCWKCARPLVDVILPMSRREECSHCQADQHICLMCEFYDKRMGCNEERAESVSQLDKANFCDYFKPAYRSFNRSLNSQSQLSKADIAKAQLAELFGDPLPELSLTEPTLSPKELAEKQLRDLLGDL